MPRFDRLYHNEKKIVLIMPSWRKGLMSQQWDAETKSMIWKKEDNFEQSEFVKKYQSLLTNPELVCACKKYGYQIAFMPHALLEPYIDSFLSENTDCLYWDKTKSYCDAFAEGNLLVTDYSSVAFDFAYLKKPVIYYQFDKEQFFEQHTYVWRSMGSEIKAASYKKKLVFLQHGVTAFKRGHFERGTNVGCEYFITTSQFEHDIIHHYLGYPEDEVPVTGFARWDVLHDKSEGHREILMMPTWRTWLDDAENEVFAESDYCKNYMALLNDPKLDELLKEYNVTLNFYLHPKFRKFITEFSVVSDYIRLIPFGEEPLNELMMQCSLLITDFSSVAWDVYYMKKPVLFYHFDMEDANKTLGFYMDMKNDLFGERAETPDELMALIVEYIQNGFQMKEEYKQAHGKYFAYVDDHNSERIWKAIQEKFGIK